MNDKPILPRYTKRDGEVSVLHGDTDDGVTDDLGSFGWLRGIKDRAIMLELRKKDGNILAIGYGWLERVEFNPSEGITLMVLGQKIRIKGRNLNGEVRQSIRLFEGITRHRVPWIQEADEPARMEGNDAVTLVDSIEWKLTRAPSAA